MAKPSPSREIYAALQRQPTQSPAVLSTLRGLSGVIAECLRLDPEMTLQRLEALLVIGSSQDITNKALAQRLGLSPNAANRHVMAALNLGLIETEVWGMDRRQNLLNLTPEGQTLIDRIHGLLRAPDPGLAT